MASNDASVIPTRSTSIRILIVSLLLILAITRPGKLLKSNVQRLLAPKVYTVNNCSTSNKQDFDEEKSTLQIGLAPQAPDEEYLKHMCEREYYNGERGHELVHLIKYQTRSLLILDVGGHEGRTTFPPMVCLPIHHRVITVEPIEENQNLILNNSKQLGFTEPSYQWRLIRAAFSNVTGNVDIFVPKHRTDNTALNERSATAHVGGDSEKVNIPVFRGDDLIYNQNEFPDFIKIDVQGSELLVMKGLNDTFSQHRNMVVMAEFDPGLMWHCKIDRDAPTIFMTNLGFKTYCHPQVFVHDGVIYAKNESTALSVDDITNEREPELCDDLVYIKNIDPNPGPPPSE